jgi:hypothetical protein
VRPPIPKPIPRARERRTLAQLHRAETKELRGAVMERARGTCEGCCLPSKVLVMDHWLGGGGRRRQRQSIETCWALCPGCDGRRTRNEPGAAYWNGVRADFCRAKGYPFHAHAEKQPVVRRAS